jgi:hypothetical protein
MHTSTVPIDDEVVDFSSPRKVLKFRVDNDVFEAAPDIAAELALRFADLSEKLTGEDATNDDQIKVIHALFKMVLFPDSADVFIKRLSDPKNPIGNKKISNIVQWLFEEYGLRPTESDSPSSAGSESLDAGTSLMVSSSARG